MREEMESGKVARARNTWGGKNDLQQISLDGIGLCRFSCFIYYSGPDGTFFLKRVGRCKRPVRSEKGVGVYKDRLTAEGGTCLYGRCFFSSN